MPDQIHREQLDTTPDPFAGLRFQIARKRRDADALEALLARIPVDLNEKEKLGLYLVSCALSRANL